MKRSILILLVFVSLMGASLTAAQQTSADDVLVVGEWRFDTVGRLVIDGVIVVPRGPVSLIPGQWAIVVGVLGPDNVVLADSVEVFEEDDILADETAPPAEATPAPDSDEESPPDAEATPDPEATPEPTPSPEVTPEPLPDARGNACRDDHPAAQRLSANYGVSYDEVIRAFCEGFGFGEIALALRLAQSSGMSYAEVLDLRRTGLGWGNVKKQVAATSGTDEASLETTQRVLGRSPFSGERVEGGAPGNSGNAGGGRPDNPGNSGNAGGGRPDNPGNSGGGGRPDNPGNSGNAGGGRPDNPGNSGNNGNGGGRPDNPGNSGGGRGGGRP
jgi:hypothetical protein